MPSDLTALTEPRLNRRDNFVSRRTLNPDLELREIVRILRRRKSAIFTALLLGVVLAALSVFFAKKEYSSTATIEMNHESSTALGLADLSGIASGLNDQDQMNMDLLTQETVILSDNTALRVIEDLKLDANPPFAIPESERGKESPLERERNVPIDRAPHQRDRLLKIFKSGLRVSLIKGTRLLTITYTDTDPNRATAVANAVVDAYMNESTQARFQASFKTSSWLTGQLAALKQKVEESQSKVTAFERDSSLTGMATPSIGRRGSAGPSSLTPTSDNVPLERLLELNRDLTSAEVARIAKEAIYKMTESQDPDAVVGIGSSPLASVLGPGSPVAPGSADLMLLQQLRQQLAQVNVQLATSGTKYGAKSPVMIQFHSEQASIDAQIRSELERIRMRTKNELDLAVLAEDGIRRQIGAQEKIVDKVTEKADQLDLLQEEAQSNREIYQDLYSKLEEASVTAGIKASNVTLVDPARIPAQPSYPKKKMTIAFGALIGLVAGFATAFSWDYFDDSIAMPEQVEQITAIPVIGAIPDFNRRRSATGNYGFPSGFTLKSKGRDEGESNAWLLRAPRSQIAESYRAFRTALLLTRAEHPPRVILFMSGSPGEGKSTTCLNTAAAFALQGDRVLYLDADLRRAQAHRFFNCSNDAGLSNCLASGLAFPETLKPYSGIHSLFLLPAGPHPPNPSELPGSKRFAELLAELRTHFDYIFIDSPPVLLVTDAQLISPLVDGFVLVLRSNKTSKRFLERCLSLMHTAKAPALGIVMNALNLRSAGYSGYGDYGSGSGYYAG
jgi:capsular exopolysaccharide synthesis family protein